MSRAMSSVVSRLLKGSGFLAVIVAASTATVAVGGVGPVPEIDPASAGSVMSLVVGTLALREGFARRRRDGRG